MPGTAGTHKSFRSEDRSFVAYLESPRWSEQRVPDGQSRRGSFVACLGSLWSFVQVRWLERVQWCDGRSMYKGLTMSG
eukprot:1161760-Pelagomonas_calceolata.AAC.8